MSERPIARLGYFDGQRLEASDLRLEQGYHIRIQRWLSRSLFSPGVADGLEVFPAEEGKKVLVTPGLALDDLGRAIVLVAPVTLVPQARFLVVRYAEHTDGIQQDGCRVRGDGLDQPSTWGGPARVVSEPEFVWRRGIPPDDTRQLVIADLELDPSCAVVKVQGGPRRTAVATQVTRVRPITFEGEKDIDAKNPKHLRFWVKDRRPTSVTLYLRSQQFSTVHYSEMGSHLHTPQIADGTGAVTTGPASGIDAHTHGLAATVADHSHTITAAVSGSKDDTENQRFIHLDTRPDIGWLIAEAIILGIVSAGTTVLASGALIAVLAAKGYRGADLATVLDSFGVGGGGHAISGSTNSLVPGSGPFHSHPVQISLSERAVGATGPTSVRAGSQLSYLSGLQIAVDGKPCTNAIVQQLNDTNPSVWGGALALGSSTEPDPLRDPGTGPIRLDLLGQVSFDEGPHEIVLWVAGDGNGGCIQYNLYVE